MTNDISSRHGIKTILVPTDFSESSDYALRTAIELAGQQNARIYLLHVASMGRRSHKEGEIKAQLAKLDGSQSVEIIPEIRIGAPYKEILNVESEKDIDLIVIARNPHTGSLFGRFRSTTEKVKKEARCSVLVLGV